MNGCAARWQNSLLETTRAIYWHTAADSFGSGVTQTNDIKGAIQFVRSVTPLSFLGRVGKHRVDVLTTPGLVLAGVKITFPFLHSTWHNLLFHIARWTVLHELITI